MGWKMRKKCEKNEEKWENGKPVHDGHGSGTVDPILGGEYCPPVAPITVDWFNLGRAEYKRGCKWFFHWIARAFQSFGKLTITVALVENSNLDCSTKSPLISKFVPQTVEFNNSTKLLFPPIVCFWPLNQPNRSLSIPSISITHISEHWFEYSDHWGKFDLKSKRGFYFHGQ